MRRLYIAVLWLFAVGFSSASFASTYCGTSSIPNGWGVNLSDSPIDKVACHAKFVDHITNQGQYPVLGEVANDYVCDSSWDVFPCGATWSTTVEVPYYGQLTYRGFWQGISRNLTLTVVRPPPEGGSESSTVLKSVEPGSGPSYLYITTIDDNTGLPAPSVHVNITADVIAHSGGHQHDDNRNTNHSGLITATATSGFAVTAKTVTTGYSYFTFTPPAASGDHTITITCASNVAPTTCSMGPGPNKVWVGIKDLLPLWEMADYNLVGTMPIHPDNHYLTSEAITAVQELAYYYHSVSYPLSPVLHLNDASLERGGIFDPYFKPYTKQGVTYSRDIQGWWIPPHLEHRRGRVIDIRANGDAATAIPRANQDDFEIMMDRRNMTYIAHDLNKDNGHYHVRLLGTEQ